MLAAEPAEETSAGGVVVRTIEGEPAVLLIRDSYRNWGFPKGHLKPGETPELAALREVAEETGLTDLSIRRALSVIDWTFRFHGRPVHKHCHLFLMDSATGTPTPQRAEGITECRWSTIAAARTLVSYANARSVLDLLGRS